MMGASESGLRRTQSPRVAAPGELQLRELEARVHADGVAQLVAQDALLAVVGQFEEVEAR